MVTLAESNGSEPALRATERVLRVQGGQVKLLFEEAYTALLATGVNALILILALRAKVPVSWLGSWLMAMVILLGFRYRLVRCYLRATPPLDSIRSWGERFVVGALLSGILWGAAGGLFFVVDSPLHQLVLGFVLTGMAAGGLATLSSYPGAFLAFLIPAAILFACRLLNQGSGIHLAMGTMTLLLIAMMALLSRRLGSTIRDSLSLRLENRQLLCDLQDAIDRQEAINGILQLQITDKLKAERSLYAARQELESRVQARTRELDKSNERLQREKDFFQVTLASIGDAVIATDAQGAATFLNRVAQDLTGWSNHEAAGRPLGDILRITNDGATSTDPVSAESLIAKDAVAKHHRCVLTRRQGEPLIVDLFTAPILGSNGTGIGRVLTLRDITERQRETAKTLA